MKIAIIRIENIWNSHTKKNCAYVIRESRAKNERINVGDIK